MSEEKKQEAIKALRNDREIDQQIKEELIDFLENKNDLNGFLKLLMNTLRIAAFIEFLKNLMDD